MKLTPAALAGIYLGTVTRWNDPAIAQSNPGVGLPNAPVLVAHRSESSGTTGIFTAYLAAVSGDWKSKVGDGISVDWPVGLGGKGSEGVTNLVKQTTGGVGYVELAYALENHLPVAAIENKSGRFVAPSPEGTSAAIDAFHTELAKDVRIPIVNASGSNAYPIAGLTFLIIPKDGQDAAKREALKAFVSYILKGGQSTAGGLHYAPIPASMQTVDLYLLGELTASGQPLH